MRQGKWERQTGKYSWGENYRIGKIVVGRAEHVSGSRDEPTKFRAVFELPSMKQPEQRFTDIEEAKARVERGVASWFNWLEEDQTEVKK